MAISLRIPDAPALAGLSFRHATGPQDAEALYAVHVGRRAHDQVDPLCASESWPSRERLQSELARAAQGQLDQWLVAQVGEQVVGYACIDFWPEADGTRVYLTLGWVLPDWRGLGIGTSMLRWTEQHILRLASEQHPQEKAEFAANASSTELEATQLLLHEGYCSMYTVLELGLDPSALPPLIALPAGLEVRPALPEHLLDITRSVCESYAHEYDGGRFDGGCDPEAFAAKLRQPRHDPTLWQVAWDGDKVAGQVLAVIENGCAAVIEVSVRSAWRRRGLARSLLLRALHDLLGRGHCVIRLRTVAEFRTRALDLYESVGFRVLKEFPRYRKPFPKSSAEPF